MQEKEIALLKQEIEFLHENITTNNAKIQAVSEDEYTKLVQENMKLKHRVAILKRVCFHKNSNLQLLNEFRVDTSFLIFSLILFFTKYFLRFYYF